MATVDWMALKDLKSSGTFDESLFFWSKGIFHHFVVILNFPLPRLRSTGCNYWLGHLYQTSHDGLRCKGPDPLPDSVVLLGQIRSVAMGVAMRYSLSSARSDRIRPSRTIESESGSGS